MVGMPVGVGTFCDGGTIERVQIIRSSQAASTVQRKAAPERGGAVSSYRQIVQEDGLLAKWTGT